MTLMPRARQWVMAGKYGERARNLEHGVGPVEPCPQSLGLDDRGFGVVGQGWGHLEGHHSVASAIRLIQCPKDIACGLHVGNREGLRDFTGRCTAGRKRGDVFVIVGAGCNRLFEDRRVRRHPAQSVVANQARELARPDQPPGDEVIPGTLAEFAETYQGML